jgi:sugar/nucleoside kinase (ribokinase family)
MNKIDYLLIGHITADLTPDGRELGGTVSYAAYTAAAFGLNVGLLTSAIEDDPLLPKIRQYTEVINLPAADTTTYENIYTNGKRTQYVRGVAGPITPQDIPADWQQAPLVHVAPIAGEITPEIVHQFPNSKRLLTLQGWLRAWDNAGKVYYRRWFDPDVLRAFDLIVFSEEDILADPDLEHDIAAVAPGLVVTRAERGGTFYDRGKAIDYAAFPAETTHPTGAGDVFAAALLCGSQHHDMAAALRLAARLGAISVTREGLESTPTPEEVREALNL